ncbi:MAG: ABC transporter ATP-binding protein [Thermodesulfobacteriota bacterium]|nr:ABC transporter ATP-binding protein [Thermodesulfobacteriota bacterium]
MLVLNNIEVIYSNVILVLKGVSMELGEGKIAALLGANGAGKTTTLKAISGLLYTELGEVTEGSIQFKDIRIDKIGPEKTARMGIIQVMEGRRMFEHFTVEEELKVGAYASGDGGDLKKNMDMVYEYFPRLKDLRRRTSGLLSGGEQQMLVIGRALIAHPKVMLLDEPSLGLSPMLVNEIFEIIKRINTEEKTSIILVEQNAKAALDVADYGYVMENGRIVLDGPADKLKDNEDIKEFYLGLSEVGERKSFREVKHYRRRKRWLS